MGDEPFLETNIEENEYQPTSAVELDADRSSSSGYCRTSTLSLEYKVPTALQKGSCEIEFHDKDSSRMLLSLSHEEILSHFLMGIDTHPSWNTRRFISFLDGIYTLHITNFTREIPEFLALELCKCIDHLAKEFKSSLLETENRLEAWNSGIVFDSGHYGYFVLEIPTWLWKLIKKFAEERQSHLGDTKWHIFQTNNVSISTEDIWNFHFELWPKTQIDILWNNNLPNGYVSLVYLMPSWKLESGSQHEWYFDIGPDGIWTVTQVKKWLLEILIPTIEQCYPVEYNEGLEPHSSFVNIDKSINLNRRFSSVNNLRSLADYLHVIQGRVYAYECRNIATHIFLDYFERFAETIGTADSSRVRPEKIRDVARSLHWITHRELTENQQNEIRTRENWVYSNVVDVLSLYSRRVASSDALDSYFIDLVLREHIAIAEDFEIVCSQRQLNRLKASLWPLYEYCYFESVYVRDLID